MDPVTGGNVQTTNANVSTPPDLKKSAAASEAAPVAQVAVREIVTSAFTDAPTATEEALQFVVQVQLSGVPIAGIEVHATDATGRPVSGALSAPVTAQIRFSAQQLPPGFALEDLTVFGASLTAARVVAGVVVVDFEMEQHSPFVVASKPKPVVPELVDFHAATWGKAVWGSGLTNGFFVAAGDDGKVREVSRDTPGALYIDVFQAGALGFDPSLPGTAQASWAMLPVLTAQWLRSDGGPFWGIDPPVAPAEKGRYYHATGNNVSEEFLTMFDRLGLDVLGYPINETIEEYPGHTVQYFQRLKLVRNITTRGVFIEPLGIQFLAMLGGTG